MSLFDESINMGKHEIASRVTMTFGCDIIGPFWMLTALIERHADIIVNSAAFPGQRIGMALHGYEQDEDDERWWLLGRVLDEDGISLGEVQRIAIFGDGPIHVI